MSACGHRQLYGHSFRGAEPIEPCLWCERDRLRAALTKLTFMGRTSGGVAARDEALCRALDAAELAIGQKVPSCARRKPADMPSVDGERLLAAAPEMLDVLHRCEMWLGTHPEGKKMQDVVRVVILKAEGRS